MFDRLPIIDQFLERSDPLSGERRRRREGRGIGPFVTLRTGQNQHGVWASNDVMVAGVQVMILDEGGNVVRGENRE